MRRKRPRPKLQLDESQGQDSQKISQSWDAPIREVQRGGTLLKYGNGEPISSIIKHLNVGRPTIYKWIDKALTTGREIGLKVKYHSPKDPVITEEAKVWVVSIACSKPKEDGYAAEMWTLSLLAKLTREHASTSGHKCLKRATKATI